MNRHKIVIIGAGPTGLGAATRAHELGVDWLLVEREPTAGGLAASFTDSHGFTWDLGGHVEFSHYERFTRLCDEALGADGWNHHVRDSRIRMLERWIPYPVQNNLHRLPPEERWGCVQGLLEASRATEKRAANYDEWCIAQFGAYFCDLFMRPYARKVWGFDPADMDAQWIGERVATPTLEKVLKSICLNEDYRSWGPNHEFRYPAGGGVGHLWQRVAAGLPAERLRLNSGVRAIDADAKVVTLADGSQVGYDHLIATLPLPVLAEMVGERAGVEWKNAFRWSASTFVGFGLRGRVPEAFKAASWLYFPESDDPQYRVTILSNYSAAVVPRPGEQYSLMAEITRGPTSKRGDNYVRDVASSLVRCGLMSRDDIESVWEKDIDYSYPTPFLGRDAIVDPLLRKLESASIFSRGRLGAWKYEVGNQDHSYMQGVEVIELIEHGRREVTLHDPEWVNSRTNIPFPFPQWDG